MVHEGFVFVRFGKQPSVEAAKFKSKAIAVGEGTELKDILLELGVRGAELDLAPELLRFAFLARILQFIHLHEQEEVSGPRKGARLDDYLEVHY